MRARLPAGYGGGKSGYVVRQDRVRFGSDYQAAIGDGRFSHHRTRQCGVDAGISRVAAISACCAAENMCHIVGMQGRPN